MTTTRVAMEAARDALRPFYNAVFNDNGDITVSGHYDHDEAVRGYFAYRALEAALSAPETGAGWEVDPLQARVAPWMQACFGPEIAADRVERNDRFLEEAVELVQSLGMPIESVLQVVGYVYGRPAGEPHQEVGGVMITLAALCLAQGLDMHRAGEDELTRINTPEMIAKIRAKQAAKPRGALPAHVEGDVLAPVRSALSRLTGGAIPDWICAQEEQALRGAIGLALDESEGRLHHEQITAIVNAVRSTLAPLSAAPPPEPVTEEGFANRMIQIGVSEATADIIAHWAHRCFTILPKKD